MNKQQGISLINLLIGLLVSMIVLVGMFMLFRNTIQTVVPASEDARSDGERISGLLAAHMMLHDAGFGIEPSPPAYGAHLQVFEDNAPLSLGSAGNAIAWVRQVGGSSQCEGLRADGEGRLSRISCTSIGTFSSGTPTPLIEPSRHSDGTVDGITIRAVAGTCQPFGIGTATAGNITVTISVQTPTSIITGEDITSTTCLVNFQP